MKITREQYRKAYQCGRKVFAGGMRITDAKALLEEDKVNPNSAADLVYNVGHMLKGHRYTRALSTATTADYLIWIEEDYGIDGLTSAVSALRQHIDYYQTISGTPMRPLVELLEKYSHLAEIESDFIVQPEEESSQTQLLEGRVRSVSVNIYERNRTARDQCVENYGCSCAVCGFDFSKVYGSLGAGFIHVHHLKELSSVGSEYAVDPIEDLRPVCPNCHSMLHRGTPPYSISELRKVIEAQRNQSAKSGGNGD